MAKASPKEYQEPTELKEFRSDSNESKQEDDRKTLALIGIILKHNRAKNIIHSKSKVFLWSGVVSTVILFILALGCALWHMEIGIFSIAMRFALGCGILFSLFLWSRISYLYRGCDKSTKGKALWLLLTPILVFATMLTAHELAIFLYPEFILISNILIALTSFVVCLSLYSFLNFIDQHLAERKKTIFLALFSSDHENVKNPTPDEIDSLMEAFEKAGFFCNEEQLTYFLTSVAKKQKSGTFFSFSQTTQILSTLIEYGFFKRLDQNISRECFDGLIQIPDSEVGPFTLRLNDLIKKYRSSYKSILIQILVKNGYRLGFSECFYSTMPAGYYDSFVRYPECIDDLIRVINLGQAPRSDPESLNLLIMTPGILDKIEESHSRIPITQPEFLEVLRRCRLEAEAKDKNMLPPVLVADIGYCLFFPHSQKPTSDGSGREALGSTPPDGASHANLDNAHPTPLTPVSLHF